MVVQSLVLHLGSILSWGYGPCDVFVHVLPVSLSIPLFHVNNKFIYG